MANLRFTPTAWHSDMVSDMQNIISFLKFIFCKFYIGWENMSYDRNVWKFFRNLQDYTMRREHWWEFHFVKYLLISRIPFRFYNAPVFCVLIEGLGFLNKLVWTLNISICIIMNETMTNKHLDNRWIPMDSCKTK